MTVNFSKYQSELQSEWNNFIKNSKANKWILFGFEGKSMDLRVHSKGDDGIEELDEELSAGKIMYGCIWIKDPNSGLSKSVFIFWQGEGVPEVTKGRIAVSNQSVKNFFRGYHIDIIVRSEGELNIKNIERKVRSASGANYSFHKEQPKPSEPVTVTKKIQIRTDELPKTDVSSKINAFKNKANEVQSNNHVPLPAPAYKKPTPVQNVAPAKNNIIPEKLKEEPKIEIKNHDQQKKSNIEEVPKSNANKLVKLFESKANEKNEEKPRLETKNIRTQESQNVKPSETKNITALLNKFNKVDEQKSYTSPQDKYVTDVKRTENINAKEEEIKQTKDKNDQDEKNLIKNEPKCESKTIKSDECENVLLRGEPKYATVIFDFVGEDEHDISVKKNEKVEILDTTDDSLCFIKNSKGQKGLIPSSFINIYNGQQQPSPSIGVESTSSDTTIQNTNFKVRVIADYEPGDTDEIKIEEDEIIIIVDETSPDWWTGINSKGDKGLVPSNYLTKNLEIGTPIIGSTPTKGSKEHENDDEFYQVIYDYEMDDENELSIFEGEILRVKQKNDDGWWLVENENGEKGYVPSNYIEPYNS